jgi:hypothetical protein
MSYVYTDIPAAGSTLAITISSTITPIPGLTDITWDGLKRAVRNVANLNSTTAQKKPGLPDLGQIKGKVFFNPNDPTHKAMRDRVLQSAAGYTVAPDTFTLTYADGNTTPAKATLVGYVTEFGQASGSVEDGTWTSDMTIEINSATFVDGSTS